MEIFLVRHGQTDGNLAFRHQHPETELNEVGKQQITLVAGVLADFKPTHIITSSQFRAVQSSRIISEYCGGIIPEIFPEFEELKRPNWIFGNRYTGLSTAWYIWRWFWGSLPGNEGERYDEMLERIIKARTHLELLPSDARVVVVSHAVFITIFLEHLCNNRKMTFIRAVRRFFQVLTIRNAAINHLRYFAPVGQQCGWTFVEGIRVVEK